MLTFTQVQVPNSYKFLDFKVKECIALCQEASSEKLLERQLLNKLDRQGTLVQKLSNIGEVLAKPPRKTPLALRLFQLIVQGKRSLKVQYLVKKHFSVLKKRNTNQEFVG